MAGKTERKKAPAYGQQVRGMNFFDTDRNLERFLKRHAPDTLKRQRQLMRKIGALAGTEIDRQAQESDSLYPATLVLEPDNMTRPQERRGRVHINRRYEESQQALYRAGTLARCFDPESPESHMLPFVTQYLVSQSDISTGCPYAMTHPVAFILEQFAPEELKERFLPEVIRTDGKAKIGGTWATEKHGGSDVGATETRAVKMENGSYLLDGLKYFTSAIGFSSFLTVATARPKGEPEDGGKGLALYLVPSHIDEEWAVPNNYNVRYLKEKMGTKGLPTGETELNGTVAYEIVPPPHGLKVMMAALGCSRVHNAMAAAGVMKRALNEGICWATHRQAFGTALIEKPMIRKRLLDISTEWMAGSALAFEAARSFDEMTRDDTAAPWMRIATALAKYKTAEQAVWCAEKALALGGGNAYTKDMPLERILRDAHVLPVWEGPEQIQALELMRMVMGKDNGAQLFLHKLAAIEAGLPDEMGEASFRLSQLVVRCENNFEKLAAQPEKAELVADDFLHDMADILAYALLCEEAGQELCQYKDYTKVMAAKHYYDRTFEAGACISFTEKPLHQYFNEIIHGVPVKRRPVIDPKAPKP